jgi:hypothetical protein
MPKNPEFGQPPEEDSELVEARRTQLLLDIINNAELFGYSYPIALGKVVNQPTAPRGVFAVYPTDSGYTPSVHGLNKQEMDLAEVWEKIAKVKEPPILKKLRAKQIQMMKKEFGMDDFTRAHLDAALDLLRLPDDKTIYSPLGFVLFGETRVGKIETMHLCYWYFVPPHFVFRVLQDVARQELKKLRRKH